MIDYITKDVTTVEQGLVVHGCNCVGGFGSGVAGAIRKKWPAVHEMFKEQGTGEHLLGSICIHLSGDHIGLAIVNAYTQLNCGYDGKVYADTNAIEKSLLMAAEYADEMKYDMYMPQIGCGLGGLDWITQVCPIVEKVNEKFPDISIHICDI